MRVREVRATKEYGEIGYGMLRRESEYVEVAFMENGSVIWTMNYIEDQEGAREMGYDIHQWVMGGD
jgi:hypothetical protein